MGQAEGQAAAPSQLAPPIQATALGVLQPGPWTPALPPWGCWSLGQASPVMPVRSPLECCPKPRGLAATCCWGRKIQCHPPEKASFYSDAPGPNLKGCSEGGFSFGWNSSCLLLLSFSCQGPAPF